MREMTRLIDKLLQEKFTNPNIKKTVKALKTADVIVIDNVSRFFFEVSPKNDWEFKDFPNLAPPFQSFFMEFKAPSHVNINGKLTETPSHNRSLEIGCLFTVIDSTNLPDDIDSELLLSHKKISQEIDFRWTYACVPFLRRMNRTLEPVCAWTFMVDSTGKISLDKKGEPVFSTAALRKDVISLMMQTHGISENNAKEYLTGMSSFVLDPCLLALSFMHCKNVTIDRNVQSAALIKSYQRKHGKPPVRYYTLNIEPMKAVLRTEGNSEKTGLKQSLHICRGHFKDFSKGKGLFGKYKGLYWWDSQARGSVSEGVVDKDYAIKAPKESQ